MKQELMTLNEDELMNTDGGVGVIAFGVAVILSAAVGASFGYGAHVGMEQAIEAHRK